MEELLNKLIEKGWKPRGHKPLTDKIKKKVKVERYNRKPMAIVIKNGRKYADDYYSLREVVSINSGLWQFVCENGMVGDGKLKHNWVSQVERGLDVDCKRKVYPTNYEYRLIESALKDESELENFLLNNIKVE